jgi:copper homeostasis protein
MSSKVTVEICVSDVESAIAAEAGGADRVELCDNLSVGGTTPSAGTIAETRRWLSIPVHVLIRPRAGDFVYSERELAVMQHDIEMAKALGVAGVVLGVLTSEASIDRDRTLALIATARPLSVTFHRAIDQTSDPMEALDLLIAMGIDRVLSSGGRPTALEGVETLTKLVDRSDGRIAIMAGGRIDLDHVETIIQQAGIREIHVGSAVSRIVRSPEPSLPCDGSDVAWNRTDAQRVAEIVTKVQGRSPLPSK